MTYDIALAPLFFVRSGAIGSTGTNGDAGTNGNWWSSLAASDVSFQTANNFHITASEIAPSASYSRWVGRSLRCLVVGRVEENP